MSRITGWDESEFAAGSRSYPVFRKGTGPGVIVVHEVPGLTPRVQEFGEEVVAAGFTVVMPSLFGRVGAPMSGTEVARTMARLCVSREFTTLAAGKTSPIASWTRALAKSLHEELGGPGVGALGMCFTGGFALAMMVDGHVAAPVLSQPSVPYPVTSRLKADLGLSPADLSAVKQRVAEGCAVLGMRYKSDPLVPDARFETLRRELGDGFLSVELEGKGHSVVTEHRDAGAVATVLDFFRERLTA